MSTLPPPNAEVPRLSPLTESPRSFDSPEAQRAWLRQLFDDTAADYDRIERWLSLGSGRWYRRQALRRAGLRPGMWVADVATGTGLLAAEAARIVGPSGKVVGVDPSAGMLAQAKSPGAITTVKDWADHLPFEDATVDFLSLGYALRHLDDLHSAFTEFARVLKPGGRICILEISRPSHLIPRLVLRGYLTIIARVGCRVAGVSPRTGELWSYYWDTIERCVPPETIVEALRSAGFPNVTHSSQAGIFSEFVGTVNGQTRPGY